MAMETLTDKQKEEKFNAFQKRWELRVKEIEARGFTRKQAEFLASEFSKLLEL